VGDAVLAIDGRSADHVTDDELVRMLTGPLGSDVVLVVRAAGVERRVSLALRDVF
jgi:C-terminal processing protease CtpA/Prc